VARDPMVDLILSHFTPRYVATGVDPNDLQQLAARMERWEDWCPVWSAEAARHEQLATEARERGRAVTATEGFLRAAIYYHYAKHLSAGHPQYRHAQERMLACYQAATAGSQPPMERVEVPFEGSRLPAWLRRPPGVARPPLAILLPGLDACKEELHAWSNAFVRRGLATLTLDGPGQGEAADTLKVRPDWENVIPAVLDVLQTRPDVDSDRIGIVGQSLGAYYAPRAASGELRLKACVANCGPFDFSLALPQMPAVSQETFRVRAGLATIPEALEYCREFTLVGRADQIRCPLLVVFGAGDRIIPASEGERLARAASGPTELVVYPEGNHVCFNISYQFRPLTADWLAEQLGPAS
jgi:dipeptidyl aminopeptidase/acylaminoacyl peptidase